MRWCLVSSYHKTGILPRAHTSTHPYKAGNDAIILVLFNRRVAQSMTQSFAEKNYFAVLCA